MKTATQKLQGRRPKLEPTGVVMLDQARARALVKQRSSLGELRKKLANVLEDDISGVVKAC